MAERIVRRTGIGVRVERAEVGASDDTRRPGLVDAREVFVRARGLVHARVDDCDTDPGSRGHSRRKRAEVAAELPRRDRNTFGADHLAAARRLAQMVVAVLRGSDRAVERDATDVLALGELEDKLAREPCRNAVNDREVARTERQIVADHGLQKPLVRPLDDHRYPVVLRVRGRLVDEREKIARDLRPCLHERFHLLRVRDRLPACQNEQYETNRVDLPVWSR